MKPKRWMLLISLCLLVTAGAALAQVLAPPDFPLVQRIGQPRPRGIVYDPNFDRFAWVDPAGRLMLVDARTQRPQHTLYESGNYTAYTFSNNGRYLALAIDVRVELWDTETGQRLADFSPDGALTTQGPLLFSEDDRLLLLNALNRAPRELRLSENDTLNLAWVWDLDDELGRARSSLPGGTFATNFFDYRYGLVLGPNRTLIAGLPGRVQVVDLGTEAISVVAEIEDPGRFERDPIDVWRSLGSDTLYVRPINSSELVAIQTENRDLTTVPLRDLSYGEISRRQELFDTRLARVIGVSNSTEDVALLRALLGEDYRARYGYRPLSVTLIDILQPITVVGEAPTQLSLLLYVFDEQNSEGRLLRITPGEGLVMALHPDGTRLALRRNFGRTPIEIYNLTTGVLERTLLPAGPLNSLLAYDATGRVLLSDFQRFDAVTGEVLLEDLTYIDNIVEVTWGANAQTLTTTLNDGQVWTWELTGASPFGRVISRERPDVRGSIIDVVREESRYLSEVFDADRRGVEVYNAATGERRLVYFEPPPPFSRLLAQLPSPDWEHYLFVYEAGSRTPHAGGYEIEVYSLTDGKLFYIAGDDLPEPPLVDYGWVDNDTIYLRTSNPTGDSVIDRIYGVEWDDTGLPACLVEAFPDDYPRWLDAWERANQRLRGDVLARFTLRLCERLPDTAAGVDDLIRRPATATPVIVTPPPVVVAGVPDCLTRRYPEQALAFAEDWRELIAGLSADEIANLEELVCSGLFNIGSGLFVGSAASAGSRADPTSAEVMTIDILTQRRSLGGFIPPQPPQRRSQYGRSVDFATLEQFRAATGIFTDFASLSPDGRLMAIFTLTGQIEVYRLPAPYDNLIETQTATFSGLPTEAEVLLRLEPTATTGFDTLGTPRPTLTPTITPTAPPAATLTLALPQRDQTGEFCPAETLYTLDAPPPDFAPPGRLLVQPHATDTSVLWVFNPITGEIYPDETLPQCDLTLDCSRSFDEEWILYRTESIVLARPDGSDARVLFRAEESSAWPRTFRWLGLNTLEYEYEGYLPQQVDGSLTLRQRVQPGQFPDPEVSVPDRQSLVVNDLTTEVVTSQPGDGPLAVVRTLYNGGLFGDQWRYYIYDRPTRTATYFARQPVDRDIYFEWHPFGDVLYYIYPGTDVLNVFDPITREHRILGAYSSGQWSRDGRYRVRWFTLPLEEQIARLVDDPRTPTPTPRPDGIPVELFPVIRIWDRTTGLTRQYCLPGVNNQSFDGTAFTWSPDNRYLAFSVSLTADQLIDVDGLARPHLLLLDTQTGSVTDLGFDIARLYRWIRTPQGGR